MTQLTPLPNSHYAMQVPETSSDYKIINGNTLIGLLYGGRSSRNTMGRLPPGTWQIVCTTKDVTEEVAKEIVEDVGTWYHLYLNYENEDETFDLPVPAFHSLLRSLNLNGHLLIIKKL